MKFSLNLPIVVIFILLQTALTGASLPDDPKTIIKELKVPALGLTSNSAVLIWDDTFTPDYESSDLRKRIREYTVFSNGEKIGSTNKKTFTAKGLNPGTNYTFSVRLSDSTSPVDEISVQAATKNQGQIYNVRRFGAKGDGKHVDTEAIQKTINACLPGGTVLIPAGTYPAGHIELKSNMTLELAKDAVLSFFGYKQGYEFPKSKALLAGPDGEINYESSSLISGINVQNVVITGEGTIDGNGDTWWPHYSETERPFTIEFVASSNVLVQGITIQDSPFWNNHLVYVDRALYSDVKFFKVSHVSGHNGDGLNPDASRDVLIVGCLFSNQDDCIAIKSGKYVDDENKRRRSSEYITIRDCVFDGDAAPGAGPLGVSIGSEISGGVKHVLVKDCQFNNVASLANVRTNRERVFGYVEDVLFENITYTNTKHVNQWWSRAPISVDHFYTEVPSQNPSIAEPFTEKTLVFKGIHFKNISIYNPVGKGIYVSGLAESPIHDIDFDKVYVRTRDGVTVQNVDKLTIKGIMVIPIEK